MTIAPVWLSETRLDFQLKIKELQAWNEIWGESRNQFWSNTFTVCLHREMYIS